MALANQSSRHFLMSRMAQLQPLLQTLFQPLHAAADDLDVTKGTVQ
jgi:hypothetical protein